MAAICGYFSLSGAAPDNRTIRSALEVMHSRGGAEGDAFTSPQVALGISYNTTHAPGKFIRTNDPPVCIAIDGLILNASELVREFGIPQQDGIDVLLYLYRSLGADCISKLSGQYA